MQVKFSDADKIVIQEWLDRCPTCKKTVEDFISYLNYEMVLTVEAASIRGEFEYWMSI